MTISELEGNISVHVVACPWCGVLFIVVQDHLVYADIMSDGSFSEAQ